MSILVTGGAGFIGSHLVERFLADSDESIVCLDNYNDYYDPALKRENVAGFCDHPQVRMVEETFCDQEAMHRLFEEHAVREVFHFGAYAGVRPSIERPHIYQKTNIEGTLSLLEAARFHPVERFVLASSSTVYGGGAVAPFQEDASLGVPLSPYGASKRAAELMGLTYHTLHKVPVVCLRPFSIYGPRLRPDLAMTIFTKAILAGTPLPLFGDGSIRRDFTDISDFCDGVMATRDCPQAFGECINLGHNHPIEIRRLIGLLEDALGSKAQIEQLEEKPGEMPITHADLSKAERLLHYVPKVPIEQGVREFVDWYRDRGV
jgi:UDP-glucuronate 4-epimerase